MGKRPVHDELVEMVVLAEPNDTRANIVVARLRNGRRCEKGVLISIVSNEVEVERSLSILPCFTQTG
jgi:hypothetical protein